jgi:hypothetical protein
VGGEDGNILAYPARNLLAYLAAARPVRPYAASGRDTLHRLSARSVMAGRRQTARPNRSTSSAPLTRGESRGRVRAWCAKQRQRAGLLARCHGLVSDQPAPAGKRTTCLAVGGTPWSLRLLRLHGEHLAAKAVSPSGRDDMAQMAETSDARQAVPMGPLETVSRRPFAATASDHSPLHRMERSSPVRNRMLESRTSGSVGARWQHPHLPGSCVSEPRNPHRPKPSV